MSRSQAYWKNALKIGLEEDGWQQDWTTLGALSAQKHPILLAQLYAKESLIWSAEGLCVALVELAREQKIENFKITRVPKDGEEFAPGDLVAEWVGGAGFVLGTERVLINLASYSCGISTMTKKIVQRAPGIKITPTRKTLPGYRELCVHAVIVGGGFPHNRSSLSSGVLIKENHIELAGGIPQAVVGARSVAPTGLKIEVEVKNTNELRQALEQKVDIVMLDNFKAEEIEHALGMVKKSNHRPVIEVSGGINESNLSHFVIEGVDMISLGALTHSVKSSDLSLICKRI